jgi:hypothetical protein
VLLLRILKHLILLFLFLLLHLSCLLLCSQLLLLLLKPLALECLAADELDALLQHVALLHQLLDKGLLCDTGVCSTLLSLPGTAQDSTAQHDTNN